MGSHAVILRRGHTDRDRWSKADGLISIKPPGTVWAELSGFV